MTKHCLKWKFDHAVASALGSRLPWAGLALVK
jgi:hypothetical protein